MKEVSYTLKDFKTVNQTKSYLNSFSIKTFFVALFTTVNKHANSAHKTDYKKD